MSYSLTELSKTELKEERKEILPKDIPSMLQNLGELLKLVPYIEWFFFPRSESSIFILRLANVELFVKTGKVWRI